MTSAVSKSTELLPSMSTVGCSAGFHNANTTDAEEKIFSEAQLAEKVINEELKIWKKACPMLYDFVQTTALHYPTLSAQWLPNSTISEDGTIATAYMIMGTNTSGRAQNHVQIVSIDVPATLDPSSQAENIPIPDHSYDTPRVKVIEQYAHDGEVNRVRHMPQDATVFATMGPKGLGYVYRRDSSSFGTAGPTSELQFHKKEGYGLSWNTQLQGRLVTGADDHFVALWDVGNSAVIKPLRSYEAHTSIVNDVQFHPQHGALFVSTSDDLTIRVFDTRSDSSEPVIKYSDAHTDSVNALAISPHSGTDYLLASGSTDSTIALWDLRYTQGSIRTLSGHTSEVTAVEWNPHVASMLVSGSNDRRVVVWDLSAVDDEPGEETEEEQPEMAFMHGGHLGRVTECCWHPEFVGVVASTAEDGLLEVWKPRSVFDKTEVRDEESHEEGEAEAE